MKILTGAQIKEADNYTIKHEPISSYDLMERASTSIAYWIIDNIDKDHPLLFLIGKGNNGGDGLAVARILFHVGYQCSILLLFDVKELSEESILNFKRLPKDISKIELDQFEDVSDNTILIDAILGTGIKGEVNTYLSGIINKVNNLTNTVISIDIPSGMKTEFDNSDSAIVKAHITLTLEFPKLALLLPEAGNYAGNIAIIDIGLNKDYIKKTPSAYYYITDKYTDSLLEKREKFAHKGTYGHALLICGSAGMAGAAMLATGGALRSGCGLVTTHIPNEDRFSLQAKYPSALVSPDKNSYFSEIPADIDKYTAVGIGSGLGQSKETTSAFEKLLNTYKRPIVFDADALNILSYNENLFKHIPEKSILTPHLGELKRLIGEWKNEEEKIKLSGYLSKELKSIIVVKGAHTMICMPDGRFFFNSSGNPGIAKGGSGDVLTGLITGLLARGYESEKAALLGVYFHGLAGDVATKKFGMESLNSEDIIDLINIKSC